MNTALPSIPPAVGAKWLTEHLDDADLVILDASWYLPNSGRDANEEYRRGHIPGAIRFDLDAISDRRSALPHMVPPAEDFAAALESLGIAPNDQVVCYDGSGVNLSSARVWWMFRIFGHQRVAILDGGFRAWARDTRPIQTGVSRRPSTGYPVPTLRNDAIIAREAVSRLAENSPRVQLVDARSAGRFEGSEAEPRAGLRRGHIPGSINLPFTLLTHPSTGLMRTPAELRALFTERGIDPARPIVSTCGSGVSACVLALAVELLRADDPATVGPPVVVYDGSWAEWGQLDGGA